MDGKKSETAEQRRQRGGRLGGKKAKGERGRNGEGEGGEKAAAQPVSDYIIALQDLKQGLRKGKRLKAATLHTFYHHRTSTDSQRC